MSKTYDEYLYDILFIEFEDLEDEHAADEYRADYPEYAAREAAEIATRKETNKIAKAANDQLMKENSKYDLPATNKVMIVEGRYEIWIVTS